MLNVKSRKLVLTLFCSLALVLVLTDGASANIQLDGHRMLRKRLPAAPLDGGSINAGNDPANSVSPVSSAVSIALSLLRAMLNDVNR